MTQEPITGGCQCGSVRYRAESLVGASICHCRMCQKAFGSFFAPLVTSKNLQWTRGEPKWFQSSNKVRRGFCGDCGTPLSYDFGGDIEVAIGTLDNPELAAPVKQVNPKDKLSFTETLCQLPFRDDEQSPAALEFMRGIVSNQHPDKDSADQEERDS